jgi:hypothetical protein
MSYDKEMLHRMYNGTSTDNGKGELESYESWLERQLLNRMEIIDVTKRVLKEGHQILSDGYILQDISPHTGTDLRQMLNNAELTLNNMDNVFE